MSFEASFGDLSVSDTDCCAPFSSADLHRLFAFRRDDLLRFAMTLTSDREIAEEAIHDAFLYTNNGLHSIENELHAYRYLKWKTRMLVYDKAGTPVRNEASSLDDMDTFESHRMDPAESLERVEEEAIVRAALLRLSDRQRAVLVARYFMGQSGEETADQFGIGLGAQKQLLHRARQSFRDSLTAVLRDKGLSVNDFVSGFHKRAPKFLSFVVLSVVALTSFGMLRDLSQEPNLQVLGVEEKRTFLTTSPDHFAAQEDPASTAEALPAGNEPATDYRDVGAQTEATFSLASAGSSNDSVTAPALIEPLPSGSGFDWEEHDLLAAYMESAMMGAKPPILNFSDNPSQHSFTNGQIELGDGGDSSVFVGLSDAANEPVQYLSLVLELDGFRFGLTPTTIFSDYSDTTDGGRVIEIGATDFILGDLQGNFDFVATSTSSWASSYLFVSLEIDSEGRVLRFTTNFLERIP